MLQPWALCRGGLAPTGLCRAVAHMKMHHRKERKTQTSLGKLKEDTKLSRELKVDATAGGARLENAGAIQVSDDRLSSCVS